MSNLSDPIEEVRIIHPGTATRGPAESVVALDVERTPQQKAQDDILDRASEAAAAALASVKEAIDWLAVVTPVKNAGAANHVQKLVEEIAEVRRIRQ